MRYVRGGVKLGLWRLAAVVCLSLAPFAAHAQSFWSDPFGTLRNVAPEPSKPWEPRQALPPVPAPEAAPQPTAPNALTLAELTEYALQNNPRARQAWFAARAAAAGVGLEDADLLPQITA